MINGPATYGRRTNQPAILGLRRRVCRTGNAGNPSAWCSSLLNAGAYWKQPCRNGNTELRNGRIFISCQCADGESRWDSVLQPKVAQLPWDTGVSPTNLNEVARRHRPGPQSRRGCSHLVKVAAARQSWLGDTARCKKLKCAPSQPTRPECAGRCRAAGLIMNETQPVVVAGLYFDPPEP